MGKYFLNETKGVIYASLPGMQFNKIPKSYRNMTHHTYAHDLYTALLPVLAPANKQKPFLDFFQLTSACVWNNCSFDGGHRSRFVNRWKAQILLNTICDYS